MLGLLSRAQTMDRYRKDKAGRNTMTRRALLLGGAAVLALGVLPATVLPVRAQLPLGGPDLTGWYDVVMAASRNKTEDVRAMLTSGKSADTNDDKGQTPLGYAASFGNVEMAQLLLKFGAKVDRRDQFGNTPLYWAAQRATGDLVQVLLDAKATVDAQNTQGITPLMIAASKGQAQIVRILLKRGADAKKQDYTGRDAAGWGEGKANVLQALRSGGAG
jgi:ankyrin repeat protein